METRWNLFTKSHPFAKNLIHCVVIDEIIKLIDMIKVDAKME